VNTGLLSVNMMLMHEAAQNRQECSAVVAWQHLMKDYGAALSAKPKLELNHTLEMCLPAPSVCPTHYCIV
jgi:hypothetical protein